MTTSTGRQAHAEAERTIAAAPVAVYGVLADYRVHHPRIMPPSLFADLEVEEGGVGAGTIFHITMHVAGAPRRLRMRVSEPEPGRVLTETNLDTDVVTVFTVDPGGAAATAIVRMACDWETGAGARGLVDRVMTPRLMESAFSQQLEQLARYMGSDVSTTWSTGESNGGST